MSTSNSAESESKGKFCDSVKTMEEFIPCPPSSQSKPFTPSDKVRTFPHDPNDLLPVSELLCFEPLQVFDLCSYKVFCKVTSASFIDSVYSNASSAVLV